MTQFFEIDFVEAGETASGDAIALRYRDDSDVDHIHVVDGGYIADGKKLVEHIREYYGNPQHIDNVVLTHPDADHARGLEEVLATFFVSSLWMNRPWLHVDDLLPRFHYKYKLQGLVTRLKKDFPNTAALERIAMDRDIVIRSPFQGQQIGQFEVLAPSYSRYLDLVVESDKTPEPERKAAVEGTFFKRLLEKVRLLVASWGEENLTGESKGTSRENESSVIQFARLCEKNILLTGDAGIEALEEAYTYAVSRGISLPGIDRLDVPHHGSRRNLSSTMLDKWLGPRLKRRGDYQGTFTAVVSANQKDEDHPKKAVVRALMHRGARVVQTDGVLWTYRNAPKRPTWSTAPVLDYPDEMEE